jgi:hypothetical protein
MSGVLIDGWLLLPVVQVRPPFYRGGLWTTGWASGDTATIVMESRYPQWLRSKWLRHIAWAILIVLLATGIRHWQPRGLASGAAPVFELEGIRFREFGYTTGPGGQLRLWLARLS